MNRTELAKEFGVSLTTIDSWIRNGMPYVKKGGPGKKWKFSLDQVETWREENYSSGPIPCRVNTRPEENRLSSDSKDLNITTALVNTSVGSFAAWLANNGHLKKNTIQHAVDLTKKWITSQ